MLNIKEPGRGGKHTLETRGLMSKRQKEEHILNPKRNINQWTRVYQYTMNGDFVKEFNNMTEASRETGTCKSCISNFIAGRTSHAGGFVWRKNGSL